MKKIITAGVFGFLSVIGYYIGSAVADDSRNVNMSRNEPVGVMVVEEEYEVAAEPASASTAAKDGHSDKTHGSEHKATNQNHSPQNSNDGGMMIEEEVSETESEN